VCDWAGVVRDGIGINVALLGCVLVSDTGVFREGCKIGVLPSSYVAFAGATMTCGCEGAAAGKDLEGMGEEVMCSGAAWGWGVCEWICLSTLGLAESCVEAGAAGRRAGAFGANFFPDLSISK